MKIAIGRIGHIGDVIACEPVARYLRHRYPAAHLSWVVAGAYRELIDTNPHIDETVVAGCTTDWIKLIGHRAFDQIVDLHPNYRTCEHCRVPLVKTHGNPFVSVYEYLDYGTLLEAFSIGAGLPKLSAAPRIYLRPDDAAAVDALGLPAEYCVIHRQSTNGTKDWSVADWRRVVTWITRTLRLATVEIGATADRAPSPLADIATDLVNRTSILGTAEVIRRARFFVGVDSAPAHLANAVRTPGVVLLGRLGAFTSYMPFNGYYASDAPGVRLVRNHAGPVRDIPVADVVAAIRQVAAAPGLAGTDAAAPPGPAAPAGHEQRRCVEASGLFDPAWYVLHCPEAATAGGDALDHFLSVGGALGYSPGPDFDVTRYATQHPEVARSGLNPLLHFLEHRTSRGWAPRRDAPGAAEAALPRIFAFLPPACRPAAREQAGPAVGDGITGFVFPYQHGGGEASRRQAVEAFVASTIQAPFAVSWMVGDRGDRVRRRPDADDRAVIRTLVALLGDDRYAKVDGKPLLLVDRSALIPEIRRTTEIWRDEARRHGFPGLYLVMADDEPAGLPHPRRLGFDAAYEVPLALSAGYGEIARLHMGRPFPEHKRFRTVIATPDDRPADAEAYRLWLTQALLDTRRRYGAEERLVFLMPWSDGRAGAEQAAGGAPGIPSIEALREAVAHARAIAHDRAGDDGESRALLDRIQRETDEGAFRVTIQMQRALQEARAELAAERRAMAALRDSLSWRVTAPLRRARQGLRSAARRLRRR